MNQVPQLLFGDIGLLTRALGKTDQVSLMKTDQGLEAGISVGKDVADQAASRMAGLSALAGKPSLGARRLTASFGNTMVRQF